LLIGELTGPITYGTTYIVRPASLHQERTHLCSPHRSIQCSSVRHLPVQAADVRQMLVRAHHSDCFDVGGNSGKGFSFSVLRIPPRSISAIIRWYSASDPCNTPRGQASQLGRFIDPGFSELPP